MTGDLTSDAFLGGALHLLQPAHGYRAGVDPVLLAASVPAKSGETVLDLGCGAGAAILCLAARVPGLGITGIEKQQLYADLAAQNGMGKLEVMLGDIADMPAALRQRQFDHVIANPPYYDRASRRAPNDPGKEVAVGEGTPLPVWVKMAAKRLKPRGQAHFIHRAERLPDLLAAMQDYLGSIEALPIAPRAGRLADRVIVRARKSGRANFRLHAPLVMHAGATHVKDADNYVPQVKAILREGAALEF